jgi:hypothetical protein
MVRWRVARHPNTPGPVLERLSQDEDGGMRRAVAGNPNTPGPILVQLAGDHDPEVHEAALYNPSLPEEYQTLRLLAQ